MKNFEENLRDILQDHEVPVPSELWEKIKVRIPAPEVVPTPSAKSGGAGKWIAGGAILIGGLLAYFLWPSGEEITPINDHKNIVVEQTEPVLPVKDLEETVASVEIHTEEIQAHSKETIKKPEEPETGSLATMAVPQSSSTESIEDKTEIVEDQNSELLIQEIKIPVTENDQVSDNRLPVASTPVVVEAERETFPAVEAVISASVLSGKAPLDVVFDAPEGDFTYEWNFGFGESSEGKTKKKIFEVPGEYIVSLEMTDRRGSRSSDEVVIRVLEPSSLHIPDAFSPNADGINDEFLPKGLNLEDYFMVIFNMKGETIFLSNSLDKGWDGSDKQAEKGINDVYKVVIRAVGTDGTIYNESKLLKVIR